MTTATHTTPPWKTDKYLIVADVPGGRPGGEVIIWCQPSGSRFYFDKWGISAEANAAYIVQAVNAHDKLTSDYKVLLGMVQRLLDALATDGVHEQFEGLYEEGEKVIAQVVTYPAQAERGGA